MVIRRIVKARNLCFGRIEKAILEKDYREHKRNGLERGNISGDISINE